MSTQVVVWGSGGHAACVIDTLLLMGRRVSQVVDPYGTSSAVLGLPVFTQVPENLVNSEVEVYVAVGDNYLRSIEVERVRFALPGADFPTLVHPSSYVAACSLGRGSVVLAGCVVSPDTKIGDFCIIGSNSCIEHGASLGEFASTGPGSIMAGNSAVGHYSFVGMGSCLRSHATVGDHSVVGANSFVFRSIPSDVIAFGTPARVQRLREHGEPYF